MAPKKKTNIKIIDIIQQNDIKEEIKQEPTTEIIEEPKEEIKQEPTTEIIEEPKEEIKQEPTTEIIEEIKEDKPKEEIKEDIPTEIIEEPKEDKPTEIIEEIKEDKPKKENKREIAKNAMLMAGNRRDRNDCILIDDKRCKCPMEKPPVIEVEKQIINNNNTVVEKQPIYNKEVIIREIHKQPITEELINKHISQRKQSLLDKKKAYIDKLFDWD
jgi:hypothetical protein